MRAARPALLSALAAAAALVACKTTGPGEQPKEDPRDRCRRSFTACAPPARYHTSTDVEAMELRKLVHLAARIDAGDLSGKAAKRLKKVATEADAATLVELEAAIEDTDNLLGRCQCPEVKPDLEKQGIREIVAARVPPRVMRSARTWTEWILTRLATIRDLTRRAATLAVESEGAAAQTNERLRTAEKELCDAVLGARAMLSPEAFETMLKTVYARREAEAGAGSAESARRIVGAYARAASCEDAPAPAN